MPERSWDQVVRDTAEKKRELAFGKIPEYIKESPVFIDWQKKYSVKQILKLLEATNFSWEKEQEQIAISDPGERLGPGFEEILRRNDAPE